jgi:regulator of sirC expression with transglutaminase-like and TPR domain
VTSLLPALLAVLSEEHIDLAQAALTISRIECPRLDPAAPRRELDRFAKRVRAELESTPLAPVRARIAAVNRVLFDLEGFRGNTDHYDDVRNSLLHVVIERRLGIPISLAAVYMTVARQAGLEVFGVGFPGHFLLRVPADAGDAGADAIILDPFDGGRELDELDLRRLLARHRRDMPWNDALILPCSTRQIIVRMLNNLKRIYVAGRSFQQAWLTTDLLVAVAATEPEDIRDRGLLAYHLGDFTGALHNLEAYVQMTGQAREDNEERTRLWEHLTTLRRRVASMN